MTAVMENKSSPIMRPLLLLQYQVVNPEIMYKQATAKQ